MVQALIETKLRDKYKEVFRHANDFLDVSQVDMACIHKTHANACRPSYAVRHFYPSLERSASITRSTASITDPKPRAVGPSPHVTLAGLWPTAPAKVKAHSQLPCRANQLCKKVEEVSCAFDNFRCTRTGLKGALICKHNKFTKTPLSDERLFDAVNVLLKMQNG